RQEHRGFDLAVHVAHPRREEGRHDVVHLAARHRPRGRDGRQGPRDGPRRRFRPGAVHGLVRSRARRREPEARHAREVNPDMRAILVALLLIVTASCGLVGRTGPACGRGLRRYYLTKTAVPGNQALTTCAAGFHMASRFEILDVSVLDYDPHLGFTTDDSGAGPPSAAAKYGSTAPSGWMRTGGGSQFTDATRAPGSAFTNCATWASDSHDAYRTTR